MWSWAADRVWFPLPHSPSLSLLKGQVSPLVNEQKVEQPASQPLLPGVLARSRRQCPCASWGRPTPGRAYPHSDPLLGLDLAPLTWALPFPSTLQPVPSFSRFSLSFLFLSFSDFFSSVIFPAPPPVSPSVSPSCAAPQPRPSSSALLSLPPLLTSCPFSSHFSPPLNLRQSLPPAGRAMGLLPCEARCCLCGALSMGQLPWCRPGCPGCPGGQGAGPRGRRRAGGGGREHLALQQAGKRSGWQSVLAPGGDMRRDQWTSAWSLEKQDRRKEGK